VDAVLFLHEQIPKSICDQKPELWELGVYRILTCTPNLIDLGYCEPDQARVLERISYCKPGILKYFSIKDKDLEEILKRARVKD
jgi:hypothetical protein